MLLLLEAVADAVVEEDAVDTLATRAEAARLWLHTLLNFFFDASKPNIILNHFFYLFFFFTLDFPLNLDLMWSFCQ